MMISRVAVAGLVLGAGCLLGLGFVARHRAAAQDGEASECRLGMPRSNTDPMVFPSKGGSEALDAAIMANQDENAIRRVISEQGGFSIPHGTSCSEVEAGAMYTQVLVTEGPFAGKTVWAPATHTHGVTP